MHRFNLRMTDKLNEVKPCYSFREQLQNGIKQEQLKNMIRKCRIRPERHSLMQNSINSLKTVLSDKFGNLSPV